MEIENIIRNIKRSFKNIYIKKLKYYLYQKKRNCISKVLIFG